MPKLSREAKRMIADIERTGKATFVEGNNRRAHAASRLAATGEYAVVKVGYNLYRLIKPAV